MYHMVEFERRSQKGHNYAFIVSLYFNGGSE